MSDHIHLPDEQRSQSSEGDQGERRPVGFWRSRTGTATIGFLAIGGFFLVAEHRAHLIPYVGYAFPFLFILACLPMHFMHGGHGGHGGHADDPEPGDRNAPARERDATHHH